MKISNKTLRSALSRYYDFEQKKVGQSITDIEGVIIRLVNTQNVIRANLKEASTGTKDNIHAEFHDSTDPDFKKALLQELIPFRDNNSATLSWINQFIDTNKALIEDILQELKSPRLSKHLNQE